MGFKFIKNSRYYGQFLNSRINSQKQMTSFQNFFFLSTLNCFLLGKRITIADSCLKFNFTASCSSLITLASDLEISALREIMRSILSLKSGASQISILQLLSLGRQWSLDVHRLNCLSGVVLRIKDKDILSRKN
jgi:hypothetical protein